MSARMKEEGKANSEGVTRSMSGTCVACDICRYWDRFYDPSEPNDWSLGHCQRYAPKTAIGRDPETGERNVIWPVTRDNDWCGDFARGDCEVFRREGISIEERASKP